MNRQPNAGIELCRNKWRGGVTLVEVLVSMIIMSIGIVLLATLLPISILRTAQATQLTQAVFLRNNAEAFVESNPGLLSGIATNSFGVVDPLGNLLVTPAQPFGGTGGLPRTFPALTLAEAESVAQLPDSWSPVLEGAVTPNLAASPQSVTFNGATITGLNVRNGSTANANNAPHRMVLLDGTGKLAVIQPLFQVSGQNLSWWNVDNTGTSLTTGPSLPTLFIPARVRVEAMQRRFTWLMTVRKKLISAADNSWAADIDVAVFFNRSFKIDDEFVHTVTPIASGVDGQPGVANVDDDGNGTADIDPGETGTIGSDDNRTLDVDLTGKPYLKKGGFMLEPLQLKWYRIVNVIPINANFTRILLDQDIRIPQGGTTISNGIFMKGIVDVYSLGTRTGQ